MCYASILNRIFNGLCSYQNLFNKKLSDFQKIGVFWKWQNHASSKIARYTIKNVKIQILRNNSFCLEKLNFLTKTVIFQNSNFYIFYSILINFYSDAARRLKTSATVPYTLWWSKEEWVGFRFLKVEKFHTHDDVVYFQWEFKILKKV